MSMPQALAGGFAQDQIHELLTEACNRVGLSSSGATLLRGHSNAVFLLAPEPVVVKILRHGSDIEAAVATTRLAQWLQDQEFPTVSLYPGVDQPQLVDGHAVTYWTYIPQPSFPVAAAELGRPLRLLHELRLPSIPLPRLDAFAAIRRSIDATTALTDRELGILNDRFDELDRCYPDMPELRDVVLHGDPQHRNALILPTGTVLCDWDSAVVGPPEWDLVTIDVHCRRFGYPPDHYDDFAAAYGRDVRDWKGYRLFRGLRELRMISTNARKAQPGPTLDEVRRRIRGLQNGDDHQSWNIL
ncbi:aminoglycoside phosphotransferase family protein [Yinghuangia aomiensis]|uniref:Aminoglycoside phosphotransferase family protein n=1 Tax=Yinghuangia aomiensis TaxID=676205 RepID=A0ABP9IC86_9ACTN